jgi:hypothetical protein
LIIDKKRDDKTDRGEVSAFYLITTVYAAGFV